LRDGLRNSSSVTPKIHIGSVVGNARSLLHVVRHDGDRVVGLELADQLLDLGSRDRVQRRGRLVQEQHFRFHRYGARDAKPLLLTA